MPKKKSNNKKNKDEEKGVKITDLIPESGFEIKKPESEILNLGKDTRKQKIAVKIESEKYYGKFKEYKVVEDESIIKKLLKKYQGVDKDRK
jgi:hypothetical protein